MSGPYFITTLEADVRIHPSQMDNNIMENIKSNLEKRYLGKCYDNYGYIDKIYEIDDNIKGGVIRAEDNTSSSVHHLSFTCRICNPLKDSIITGKIVGINNMIIVAENGPIRFIIGESNINKNNVQFRKSAYYPMSSKGEMINKPISVGTYVMVQVMNKKIVKGKKNIIVFGRLESVIPEDLVMQTIKSQYETNDPISAEQLIGTSVTETDGESEQHVAEEHDGDDQDDQAG
jgi:DNA-directed RNA polymerase subunit E'/Rpb7